MYFLPLIKAGEVLDRYQVSPGEYILATVHRASNTDERDNLSAVLNCLAVNDLPVILPLHPRTSVALERFNLELPPNTMSVDPVSYLTMVALEKNARHIMTDSGGVQKEAYILGVPCITLREETEWVETLADGWNHLVGLDQEAVVDALSQPTPKAAPPVFGDGTAAQKIVRILDVEKD